jgi:NADH:flavin oxidoreductase / NADH oxidase family
MSYITEAQQTASTTTRAALFTPVQFGAMSLKHRIVMAPLTRSPPSKCERSSRARLLRLVASSQIRLRRLWQTEWRTRCPSVATSSPIPICLAAFGRGYR